MSTKTPHKPAVESKTVETVARLLDIDPEIAEYYLFSFFKEWGREKYLSLIRYMAWCIENGKEASIPMTLAHDLTLKNENGQEPRTSGF